METTPTPCIFCGHDRDPDSDVCPSCGRGWIDRRVSDRPESGADDASVGHEGSDGGVAPAGVEVPQDDEPATADDAASAPSDDDDRPDVPVVAPIAVDGESDQEGIETGASPAERRVDEASTFEENLHPPLGPPEGSPATPEVAASENGAPENGAPENGTPTPEATPRTPPSHRVVVALAVIGVIAGWFLVLAWITSQGGEEEDPSIALPTTTTTTDGGGGDNGQTTTTDGDVTTTSTTPTTTTTIATLEPEGDPLALGDLALGAFALGPFEFGAGDALGRLVATFDQPDSITTAGTEVGLCDGDTGVAVAWGPLTAIFEGTTDDAVLVGYRLDGDGGDHPAAELATLSGLQVGATISELESVYSGFAVEYEEVDGLLSFVVVRTDDDVTLLWGPVTSDDDGGIVEGVYSPRPCDNGPTPGS